MRKSTAEGIFCDHNRERKPRSPKLNFSENHKYARLIIICDRDGEDTQPSFKRGLPQASHLKIASKRVLKKSNVHGNSICLKKKKRFDVSLAT